ncbi:MAG: ABC transporter ATP-binding protein [Dermabacteraceae bacterium]
MTSTVTTQTAATASARTALQLDGVSVIYPDGRHVDGTPRTTTALDSARLDLGRGDFAVVLGPSGSGKSTLLSVAAGLVVPDAGRVLVDGTDLAALDEKHRTEVRRDRIGVVFQQPNLLPALRVREQLMVNAHLAGLRGRRLRATRDRADELLERVGMERYADRRPHELSGGQRQRVNIARALFTDPAVLLVDEPTSALDHERSRSVVDLLVSVTRELTVATVMVTHDEEFAEDADQVIVLRDGRVQPGRG